MAALPDLPPRPWAVLASGSVEPWTVEALVAHAVAVVRYGFTPAKVGMAAECVRDLVAAASVPAIAGPLVAALQGPDVAGLVLDHWCTAAVLPWWHPSHAQCAEQLCVLVPALRAPLWRKVVASADACLWATQRQTALATVRRDAAGHPWFAPQEGEARWRFHAVMDEVLPDRPDAVVQALLGLNTDIAPPRGLDAGFRRTLAAVVQEVLRTVAAPELYAPKLQALMRCM